MLLLRIEMFLLFKKLVEGKDYYEREKRIFEKKFFATVIILHRKLKRFS